MRSSLPSSYLPLYFLPFSCKIKKNYIRSSFGGDKEIRTLDPLRARQVLSQLSYTPKMVDLQGLEPRTYRL